jgi:hypothetical protein
VIWPLGIWTSAMFACLVVAGVITRFHASVILVIIANYFGTAGLRDMLVSDVSLMLIGFLDFACAMWIIAMRLGDRANFVAALFLGMLPIYAIGWLFQWSDYATFTAVEPLGWLQIMVIGNVDRGAGRILGKLGRRDHGKRSYRDVSHRPVGSVADRNVPRDLDVYQAGDRR